MGIKHVDTKASGEKGYASEWNKDHEIDSDVECAKHQHKEHVIENRTDFPAGPVEGQIIYRTDTNTLYIFDGAEWDVFMDEDNIDNYIGIAKGTHYWSCPGNKFVPSDDAGAMLGAGVVKAETNGMMTALVNNIVFVAPVELPHGAVVTAVIVYGNDPGAAAENWELNRILLTNPGAFGAMADEDINVEDNVINNPTINNNLYCYTISTSSFDTNDELFGARITYTL